MGVSNESAAMLGPATGQDRKASLDTLRGVALLGILLMNIVAMGMPFSYNDPTIYGGDQGLDLAAWVMNNLFFEGTMRGLFSLMFGAGIVLMAGRAEASGRRPAGLHYRRMGWLAVFGLALPTVPSEPHEAPEEAAVA